jgi:hypothetical protein
MRLAGLSFWDCVNLLIAVLSPCLLFASMFEAVPERTKPINRRLELVMGFVAVHSIVIATQSDHSWTERWGRGAFGVSLILGRTVYGLRQRRKMSRPD